MAIEAADSNDSGQRRTKLFSRHVGTNVFTDSFPSKPFNMWL